MPFDSIIGLDTDPTRQTGLLWETDGAEFVPDHGHIDDDLVLLADGSLLAMIKLPGYPFELESFRSRNIRRRQINGLIRGISDDNVTLSCHLVHHDHVPPRPLGRFRSRFAKRCITRHERMLDGTLCANDWFKTIVVAPRFRPLALLRRKMLALGRQPTPKANARTMRQMNAIMQTLMAYFGRDGARRLGLRPSPHGYRCSEIAEARRLILMGRWQEVPLTTGRLGDAIYTERVICGTRAVRIEGLDGPRYAKTLAMRDYPSEYTVTGQFSHLVQLDEQFPFVFGQHFRALSREGAGLRLYLRLTRMANALDARTRGIEKLEEAQEEVAANEAVRGEHALALTVFAPTMAAQYEAASAAGAAINRAGAVPIAEDGGSFAAFWSTLPGNPAYLASRAGGISSRNFTAFASLEGYPSGAANGHWGPAILRFATSGRTAYDFVPHVADIGHALFIGRSTSGKTLLMMLLAAALEQALSLRDRVFIFDKDQGAEPFVRASGGAYLRLHLGEPLLAPLRGLDDTPANRAFLVQWITALMLSDSHGPLQPQTTAMLHRAVARQMRLPPHERRMGAVRAFLGYGKGTDGERLDRWCWGGADGWLFDGERDLFRVDAPIVGADLTQLFGHPACPHVAAYLVQRINGLIDGRRVTVIADEVRFYLLSAMFAEMIIDFSLTLRKKNGQLWLAGQEAGHILNSQVGTALANQAQTMWLFPIRDANEEEYERLGCTAPMYRALTEYMPALPYRSVLLKRDGASAVLRTELTDMDDEIAVLSGREETVRLIPDILAAVGDDPEAFTDAFIARCAALRATSGGLSP